MFLHFSQGTHISINSEIALAFAIYLSIFKNRRFYRIEWRTCKIYWRFGLLCCNRLLQFNRCRQIGVPFVSTISTVHEVLCNAKYFSTPVLSGSANSQEAACALASGSCAIKIYNCIQISIGDIIEIIFQINLLRTSAKKQFFKILSGGLCERVANEYCSKAAVDLVAIGVDLMHIAHYQQKRHNERIKSASIKKLGQPGDQSS